MRKHGVDAVILEILCIGDVAYIADLEQRAIAAFESRDRRHGYNVCVGGVAGPMVDRSHSPRSRAKMSESQKRRARTPEEAQRLRDLAKGRVASEDHRKKLSEAAKRRVYGPELASAVSAGLKRRFAEKPHSCVGRALSAETRAKISAALTGRKTGNRYERTPAIRAKLSASKRGKRVSQGSLDALAAGRRLRWKPSSIIPDEE